jgi:ATP-dependent DNA helicase RecG
MPTHSHLLDEVQEIANTIRDVYLELADALIQRWTGTSQQFAKV